MQKRWALASAAAAILTVATASTAGAIPDHKMPEVWNCGGQTTLIFTAGRNGWVNGVHYHAVEFSVAGTFTPTGGAPEPVSFGKTWAGGRSGPGAITCTQQINETDADGTFVGNAQVTAIPVN